MTKPTKLNIISKLNNFSNIQVGEAPTTFYDDNMYPLLYNKYGAVSLQKNDETYLSFTNDNAKIAYMQTLDSIKTKNIQLDCTILLTQIRAENILYAFVQGANNLFFKISIKNTFRDGIIITSNNMTISANYKFEANKKYNISISKEDDTYTFYINGISHGYKISPVFTNNILAGQNLIFGSNTVTNTSTSNFRGNLYNLNISYGATLINYKSYTKYGNHLISRQYFGNHNRVDTATLFYCNTETINESPIVWEIPQINNKEEYAVLNNSLFKTKLNGPYTITFNLKPNNVSQTSNLFTYNNYRIILNIVVPVSPAPDVTVNEYTTSALNFENGLVDQIGTTVWTKEGTSDITSVNKIFGENSFETKALGDSLSTTSKLITGGTTPFTIEFYALVNASFSANNNFFGAGYALLSQNRGGGDSDQQILVDANLIAYLYRGANGGASPFQLTRGSYKNLRNELNKYTFTYDGSALRLFINDQLDIIVGTNNGWDVTNPYPFTFFDNLVSGYSQYRVGTKGIIDNINIHDGIATKVRDHDPYEEFLVVDLAFDGENNSTKIVDNGSLKSNWLVKFNNPSLKTSDSFDNKSALYLNGNQNIKSDIDISFNSIEDFTFSFEFMRIPTSQQYIVLISTNTNNYQTSTDVFSINAFTNNYTNVSASYLRNKLSFIDEKNFENDATNSLISKTNILDNVKYKIDIVRKSKITYLYINNILDTQSNIFSDRAINFGKLCIGHCAWSENSGYAVGLNGYIKNFKIYKDAAVIPEDPTGKIQLDFDNNLVDKYGNSTWTNNGVTFDQVNSVKGHAAYFNGDNKYITSGINDDLNYGTNDFSFEFDVKNTNVNKSKLEVVLCSGDTAVTSSTTKLQAIGVHYQSNFNGSVSQTNELKSSLIFGYAYNNIDYLQSFSVIRNVYYHYKQTRKGNALIQRVNDVITNVSNYNLSLPININNNNNTVMGKCLWRGNDIGTNINSQFDGYIDNFKSIKDYKENVIIDKPAFHLPLETNAINTGFTPLTINNVGSPTYTTIDGKKCIKFESGKYLTINSNNIFNLGTSSDFYMEFDINIISFLTYNMIMTNNNSWANGSQSIWITSTGKISIQSFSGLYKETTNSLSLNTWYTIKLYRKGNIYSVSINDMIESFIINDSINLSINSLYISCSGWAPNSDRLNGYMSNFKMFVGTSQLPETYNDKKVLDLDFKPTGKSYLFKDNNNKCVIHPVNITQRDYQDSQYCCTFNGTNQYLQLGKNDLLNFGLDDFVIEIIFKTNESKDVALLHSGETSNINSRAAILIGDTSFDNRIYIHTQFNGTYYYIASSNSININEINKLIVYRKNGIINIILNDILSTDTFNYDLNFNINSNTYIGRRDISANNYWLKGTIYSIKVLRNTTDLSLLEDENTNVIVDETEVSYTLSNGFDEVSISKDTLNENFIQITKSDDKVVAIIDDEILEVPTTAGNVDTNDLYLFNEYKGNIKDLRVYNKAFYDRDVFEYDGPYDTELGLIDTLDNEYDEYIMVDQGDYIIKGYFEGIAEPHKWRIYNSINYNVLISGTSINYYYDGVDHLYKDDYKILDMVTNKTYDIVDMGPPGSIKVFINSKVCTGSNFVIRAYRRDSGVFIGEYELDKTRDPYECTVHNLDTTKTYDIMLFDKNNNVESRVMSNRSPEAY